MSDLDWAIFLAFIAYVVWDGVRRGRKAKDLEGYFAGGRSIPWWAAGLSVMATQASAITVIGTTGQGHEGGLDFVQTYLSLPLAMVLLCIFMVPLLRRLPILTAYEYLETRFNPATRTFASLLFLISRSLAFGVVLYAPSVVLSTLLGLNIQLTVVIIGVLTTVYTVFGGVHAVIWTDVKQMVLILGGLVACFGIVLARVLADLDLDEALRVTGAAGKLNAIELEPESTEFVPRSIADVEDGVGTKSFWEEKYNIWSGAIGGLFLMLAYFGADQSQVQRILTNPSERESRLALLVSAVAKIPMQVGVLALGVMIWLLSALATDTSADSVTRLVYNPKHEAALDRSENPRVDAVRAEFAEALVARKALLLAVADSEAETPAELEDYRASVRRVKDLREEARLLAAQQEALENGEKEMPTKAPGDRNFVFPVFILNALPPILLGLMIAAIFAAAMSSSDSALNSLSSAFIVDFYKRWLRPNASEQNCLRASKMATIGIGAFATSMALAFDGKGSVIELVNRIPSYFYGSLFGVFALGFLVPAARGWAGFAGLVGGMGSVLVVDLTIKVEWLWYNVVGIVGVFVFGGLAALIIGSRRSAS